MKRISGGQLSRKAKATLLSSHAGGPRAAAGDTTFASQTNGDRVVKSQPAANPKDLPAGSDVTAQTTEDSDSESRHAVPTSYAASGRKLGSVIDGAGMRRMHKFADGSAG